MGYDAFLTDTLVLDKSVYKLWLLGFNVEQATSVCAKQNPASACIIKTQYRNFELLEQFLHRPRLLTTQLLFALPVRTMSYIVNQYYSFDPRVARELLGRKLSNRARKDLDEICLATRIPQAGCRRMFDNLKRIIKRIEDVDGLIIDLIANEFNLERDLASHYAHIVFINTYRLDTGKKKLAYLGFYDFEFDTVASAFIQHLTPAPDQVLEDFDLTLIQDARGIIFNNKEVVEEWRTLLVGLLPAGVMEKSGVYAITRNALIIVSSLGNSKDQRDVFLSVFEKLCEPAYALGWSVQDAEAFFNGVLETWSLLESLDIKVRTRYETSFKRVVTCMKLAMVRFSESWVEQNRASTSSN